MAQEKLSAGQIKTAVTENKGALPKSHALHKQTRASILFDMEDAVKGLDAARAGGSNRRPKDISFAQFVKTNWGFAPSDNGSPDSFYELLGVDPSNHTLESLMTMPEFPTGYRWLAPEVIREAIRLGLQKNPIYPGLIAGEENVTQPTVIMPHINSSNATPKRVGEAETIPVGSVSFGQKSVSLHKAGIGFTLTDEVRQFVALNVLSVFMQDVGTKLNLALDTMAIETLINGDQKDGSNTATTVGVVDTGKGITYDEDLLEAWITMGRLGKTPTTILSNKVAALHILKLPEFKGYDGLATKATLELDTPIPTSQKYRIHGAMPETQQAMLIDSSSALIKLNASALRVESERIAERQVSGTYVSLTTGFANLFNDARLILDGTLARATKGYPSSFEASEAEKVKIS